MTPQRVKTALPLRLFVLTLLCPSASTFMLGSLALSPYRLVLIAMAVPVGLRYVESARPTVADVLLVLHCVWVIVALITHHGMSIGVESGGIYTIELLGPYFLFRVYLRSLAEYRALIRFLMTVLLILLPLAWFESLTGNRPILDLWQALTGKSTIIGSDPRFGLDRAATSFDHPILFGMFCATLLGMAHFTDRVRAFTRRDLLVLLTTIPSLSSGALAALTIQSTLIGWRHVASATRYRWIIYLAAVAAVYIAIDTLSNRSGIRVLLHYLTFSAHTAFNRVAIFEYGIQDVYRNPLFGIGFNVWSKPEWMHSDSMDNFWLVTAVRYGVPAFAMLLSIVFMLCYSGWRGARGTEIHMPRLGWVISVVGLSVGGATVHFWNHAFVYFAALLGIGAALCELSRRTGTPTQARTDPVIGVVETAARVGVDKR